MVPLSKHVCRIFLQCAAITLGHPGAVPNSNFVRKLFATQTSAGDAVDKKSWKKAVKDLASIDAHSAKMAETIHYNLSDRVNNGVVKKSVRAFVDIMKTAPIDFPDEELSPLEFEQIVNHIGKRGVKRQFNAIEANPNQEDAEMEPLNPREAKARRNSLIDEAGLWALETYEVPRYKNWMFFLIDEYLTGETGDAFSYNQVTYRLRGRLMACSLLDHLVSK